MFVGEDNRELTDEATGLQLSMFVGEFDPQADAPFLDGGDATAASTLQDVRDSLARRGIRTDEAVPPPQPKQPFWRRLFRS